MKGPTRALYWHAGGDILTLGGGMDHERALALRDFYGREAERDVELAAYCNQRARELDDALAQSFLWRRAANA